MEDAIGQSLDTSAPVQNTGSVSETSAPQEKMLKQSEVNDIVGKRSQEAASRAVEQYKRSLESQQQSYQPQSQHSEMSEERFRKLAAEEAQRLRDQERSEWQTRSEKEQAQRIVKNFWDKIEAGKQKYEDFDKVTNSIDLQAFPNSVQILAESLENSADVLYELGKNPFKLDQLERLAERSPRMAYAEAKRLSDSIKSNETASSYKIPNAPLSQQRPTNVGTDAGKNALSMRDLKAKYRA
jgi:hypothetical protein